MLKVKQLILKLCSPMLKWCNPQLPHIKTSKQNHLNKVIKIYLAKILVCDLTLLILDF